MSFRLLLTKITLAILIPALLVGLAPQWAAAQAPPPSYGPQQLDGIVARIALYPDPLLAQIMAASTFPDQIPDAAMWADQHHYLSGDELAKAIMDDQLPWDASVQALLPFPSVLDMMATDPAWTNDLGNAVLAQRDDVMDAVQRQRHLSYQYGYLRTNGQVVVSAGPYITIAPVNPGFIVVPAYDPLIVFAAPRPGFFVGGAIHFGFGIGIGAAFAPWGWGGARFGWGDHAFFLAGHPWGRTWANRAVYAHPYAGFHAYSGPRAPEHHQLIGRSPAERSAAREGRASHEEHGRHR
jgi:hypothetical protein